MDGEFLDEHLQPTDAVHLRPPTKAELHHIERGLTALHLSAIAATWVAVVVAVVLVALAVVNPAVTFGVAFGAAVCLHLAWVLARRHRVYNTASVWLWYLGQHALAMVGMARLERKASWLYVRRAVPFRIAVEEAADGGPTLAWELAYGRARVLKEELALVAPGRTPPPAPTADQRGRVDLRDRAFALELISVPGRDDEPAAICLELRAADGGHRLTLALPRGPLSEQIDEDALPIIERRPVRLPPHEAEAVAEVLLGTASALAPQGSPAVDRLARRVAG